MIFKPHIFPLVIKNLKEGLKTDSLVASKSKLFVSIMAGIKMETLADKLKTVVESPRIIRTTVNTPSMVRAGCSVMSIGEGKFI